MTELNKLDGFTGSTTELNKVDGLTASTAELNKVDGLLASTGNLNLLYGSVQGSSIAKFGSGTGADEDGAARLKIDDIITALQAFKIIP